MEDWVPDARQRAGAAAARGGRDHRRQDQHARDRASCRSPSRTASGPRATPGTRRARPAAPPAAAPPRWPPAWSRSPTRTTAAARSGFPASCCGLVGLKPSRGRVSLAPDSSEFVGRRSRSRACVSRNVADTALALDVIAGYEPGDPYWAPDPSAPFVEAVEREPGHAADRVRDRRRRTACPCTRTASPPRARRPSCSSRSATRSRRRRRLVRRAATSRTSSRSGPPASPTRCTARLGRAARRAARPRRARAADARRWSSIGRLVHRRGLPRGARLPARAGAPRSSRSGSDIDVLLTPTLAQPPLRSARCGPKEGEPPIQMLVNAAEWVPFTPVWNVTGQPRSRCRCTSRADGPADRRAARRAAGGRGAPALAVGAARGGGPVARPPPGAGGGVEPPSSRRRSRAGARARRPGRRARRPCGPPAARPA